jgi:hypothetical protein
MARLSHGSKEGMRTWRAALLLAAIGILPAAEQATSADQGLSDLVLKIKAVGPEGAGNLAASDASRELAARGPEALPALLRALDGAGPLAANWLRAAIDSIAERALLAGRPLPAAELEAFLLDRTHDGPARRLAYEWIVKADPTAPDRLVPGMIDDPSVDLRRDAVARRLDAAGELFKKDDKPAAIAAYRSLFPAARDEDQVELIAKRMQELGEKVDVGRHYGFVRSWRLIGPFDNADGIGFAARYPPEDAAPAALDWSAEHPGKSGPVLWTEHATDERRGVVDLNKTLGKLQGVVAYGAAVLRAGEARPVSIRVGTPNAVKVWLNGKLLINCEEYHHGMSIDQYRGTGELEKGDNLILIKLCQNEQKEDWAQAWSFQLRACDLTGGGLP